MTMNRRDFVFSSMIALFPAILTRRAYAGFFAATEYDVRKFGAIGNGVANDTAALQKAIDTAAANGGGRVVLPGGMKFLSGALHLKNGIDLHLADGTTLMASTDSKDYPETGGAILMADGAQGLRITGAGNIDGQAMKFMTTYSEKDQRWEPKAFRPYMFSLRRCQDLQIEDIQFGHSPNWGMHLLGCEDVLVSGVRIRNYMDVPNCDGIDPDHCRRVEIRNCDIVCADDSIVIKTSEQAEDYGPSHDIVVKNCVVTSRDSGLKVGTETFSDISKIVFEHCTVKNGGRGPTITHRQPGNIEDIEFRDITVSAEHHAARWWGWGEAVSVTAWPRTTDGHVGTLKNVRMKNIKGRAENSVRIDGQPHQPVENVLLEDIDITINRWTDWPGERFDNRPTKPDVEGLEPHRTPVFWLRNAKDVTVRGCTARWGKNRQAYFSHALEAHNVHNLRIEHFNGKAAFPEKDEAIFREN